MSRRNSLKKRRQHHAAMVAEERARDTLAKKKRLRRLAKQEKSVEDKELAGALEKMVEVGEGEVEAVPKIGAPISEDKDDVKMGVARVGSGRIRKKKKKDLERAKKIRKRMLERGAMLMDN